MSNHLASWHHVITTRDLSNLDDILADNAVFHSPIVHTPQLGKDINLIKDKMRAMLENL
ncbi:MAG: hypothetical protein ACI9BO_000682 [Zhongshania sp.]|jgi:hypothetical protein